MTYTIEYDVYIITLTFTEGTFIVPAYCPNLSLLWVYSCNKPSVLNTSYSYTLVFVYTNIWITIGISYAIFWTNMNVGIGMGVFVVLYHIIYYIHTKTCCSYFIDMRIHYTDSLK